jgi:hypothetical protein
MVIKYIICIYIYSTRHIRYVCIESSNKGGAIVPLAWGVVGLEAQNENNKLLYSLIKPALLLFHLPLFFSGSTAPSGPGPHHWRGFTITLRHTALGRTPLDEWSSQRRDLYLTTHNIHKGQTSMPLVGFEPTSKRTAQTNALDRAGTGSGH